MLLIPSVLQFHLLGHVTGFLRSHYLLDNFICDIKITFVAYFITTNKISLRVLVMPTHCKHNLGRQKASNLCQTLIIVP